MKTITLILLSLFLSSCCTQKQRAENPWGCRARAAVPVLATAGLSYLAYDSLRKRKDDEVEISAPPWFDPHPTKAVRTSLVSPTTSIFSTHTWKSQRKNLSVTYGGKSYRVRRVIHIRNPEKASSSPALGKTDVGIFVHDAVTGVPPVKIAQEVQGREEVTGFLNKRTTKGVVNKAGTFVTFSFSVAPGDSSSPVVNDKGQLVTLVSTSARSGPNLSVIREEILFYK